VIALEGVAARQSPMSLSNLSLGWGPGLHAIVGGLADGGPLLLALVAGWARPRAGTLRVLDGDPRHRDVRRQIAWVSLQAALPQGLRVAEVLATAARLRGEASPPAEERLAVLGVESLARRRVETLSAGEERAVALAEAVTSTKVRVLLIEEPFAVLDARAIGRLPSVLRERADAGHAVVVATGSPRDAADIADDAVTLVRGAVGPTGGGDPSSRGLTQGARLRIVTPDPHALSAALARETSVEAIARRETLVTARGRDAVELARGAARAIAESGADVVEVRLQPAPPDDGRAVAGPEERPL
jgi:ABC-type multidrug transport system ATPase subunit